MSSLPQVRFQLERGHSDEDEDSVDNTGSISSDSESGFSEQDMRESISSGSQNTPDLRHPEIHHGDVNGLDSSDYSPQNKEDTIRTTPFVDLDDASDTCSEHSTHQCDITNGDQSPSSDVTNFTDDITNSNGITNSTDEQNTQNLSGDLTAPKPDHQNVTQSVDKTASPYSQEEGLQIRL